MMSFKDEPSLTKRRDESMIKSAKKESTNMSSTRMGAVVLSTKAFQAVPTSSLEEAGEDLILL